ncbi:MAG: signal peptidase II [Phycisphaerales bacterium]|nr:signal peptidase II [Phycisphaerales bacterium]
MTIASLVIDLGSKSVAFERVHDAPVVVRRADVMAVSAGNPRNVATLVPRHDPVVVVPKVLEFTLVLNPGAVFGMGPGQRWFFITFTAVALGFGVWMFGRWTGPRDAAAHVGLGLLIGGGLGNLYDRLIYGCVRDFLHPLPGVRFPFGWRPFGGKGEVWPYVSNVADLFLLVGIGMLVVFLWRKDTSPSETERRGRSGASGS